MGKGTGVTMMATYKLKDSLARGEDQWGNYTFGNRNADRGPVEPAVYAKKKLTRDGVAKHEGTWVAFLGGEGGFVFEGNKLREYASPMEALEEINALLGKDNKKRRN
jgi:hypothetical protein